MNPYTIAYHHASRHGVITAIHIPDHAEPVPEDVLDKLPPEEVAIARAARGYRQVQYVGGRLALRSACAQLGSTAGPLLSTPRGAPVLPRGLIGSVSHKRELAIALVARDRGWTVGVDLEEYEPERLGIADRILTPEELEATKTLPSSRKWIALLLRFSIKEAIYKAIDPWVRRYVGFHEAVVTPDLEGGAAVVLNLEQGEGPFSVDARYQWLRGRIVSSVRIRLADGDGKGVPSPRRS